MLSDEAYIGRALALAERGRGLVSPNPIVGAAVVSASGHLAGEGWHEGPGTAHAEVVALREAGEAAHGSTLYTSLEPCVHIGRTPPCVEAILAAGVARVVSAMRDPNPIVDGRGFAELERNGVEIRHGVLADEAARQNEAFVKHVRTGLPFVTWKMAASLDGKVAARDGSSRWITGESARADVHRLRAWSDAIVVGAAPTLVATTDLAPPERRDEWEDSGAEVVVLAAEGDRVPIGELVSLLGKRDLQGVLLEGGPTLAFAAIEEGVVDKVIVYLAPKLIGGVDAPTVLGGRGFAPISSAARLRVRSFDPIGEDLKVEADVHRDR